MAAQFRPATVERDNGNEGGDKSAVHTTAAAEAAAFSVRISFPEESFVIRRTVERLRGITSLAPGLAGRQLRDVRMRTWTRVRPLVAAGCRRRHRRQHSRISAASPFCQHSDIIGRGRKATCGVHGHS